MRVEPSELTENQRCVVTLLQKSGPLSKGELAERGNMGWATVVKVVGQLSAAGIVERLGTAPGDPTKKGKRAYLYGLTRSTPLAVGIDVEYRTTTMVLTNLYGDILAQQTTATVEPTSDRAIREFLYGCIQGFLNTHSVGSGLCGIGIGVPGIGFPSRTQLDNLISMQELSRWLAARLRMNVQVRDNTKSYAVFEQWSNQTFAYEDFVFISIRTGIGSGIFHHGDLYLGTHGLSGEIGHIQTVPKRGVACRCGKSGCMETVVGQRNLYRSYCLRVLRDEARAEGSEQADQETLSQALCDLFSRARRGESAALRIVTEAAEHLGRCIAYTILVLDISNIIISGHFGPDGVLLEELLQAELARTLLRGASYSVRYVPFDPLGHVRGAALLVLKEYLIDLRSNHIDHNEDL
ncbi:MAG: ROK family transcriptional regulator [Spirochaetaceae bacterium]|nr:MAG: ROK family transcriptional regulator [Spirochaetaceae bacterium]